MNSEVLIFLATAGLISIILVVIIWQLAASWRAKAALVREGEYRKLAESAVAGQEQTMRQIDGITAQLSEMSHRLDSIEKTLTVID